MANAVAGFSLDERLECGVHQNATASLVQDERKGIPCRECRDATPKPFLLVEELQHRLIAIRDRVVRVHQRVRVAGEDLIESWIAEPIAVGHVDPAIALTISVQLALPRNRRPEERHELPAPLFGS